MRGNTMGMIYFGLAGLFIYLAIVNVNTESWNLWTFFFAAVAAIDIMIGIRFFRSTPNKDSHK
ncbi:YdiK family protein [Salibacterium aidingense]|uniref:YdiK family protein n=1 Tax=Salibacterium aidingense TaxID=384933 RepID=UPI000411EB86|nr:YdiK family protein [Salibacterium aidingense]